MRIFTFLVGLFLAFSAFAGPPDGLYPPLDQRAADSSARRYSGDSLSVENATGSTLNSTTDRFQFGFQSEWVSVCLQANQSLGATTDVYIRFEFDASTDLWSDRLATQSSYYIAGTAGVTGLGTRAIALKSGGDGTDSRCVNLRVKARGITMHTVSSGTATLDVIAY